MTYPVLTPHDRAQIAAAKTEIVNAALDWHHCTSGVTYATNHGNYAAQRLHEAVDELIALQNTLTQVATGADI